MAILPVIFAPQALRDLAEIDAYLFTEAGERTADRMLARLEDRASLLSDNPKVGVLDETLGPGARRVVVAPYLIVYDHDEISVTILRIVHGARDLPSLFGDTPV